MVFVSNFLSNLWKILPGIVLLSIKLQLVTICIFISQLLWCFLHWRDEWGNSSGRFWGHRSRNYRTINKCKFALARKPTGPKLASSLWQCRRCRLEAQRIYSSVWLWQYIGHNMQPRPSLSFWERCRWKGCGDGSGRCSSLAFASGSEES